MHGRRAVVDDAPIGYDRWVRAITQILEFAGRTLMHVTCDCFDHVTHRTVHVRALSSDCALREGAHEVLSTFEQRSLQVERFASARMLELKSLVLIMRIHLVDNDLASTVVAKVEGKLANAGYELAHLEPAEATAGPLPRHPTHRS